MAKYVLAFRGRPDRSPAANEDQAWGAWFGSISAHLTDMGNRVGTVRTLTGADAGNAGELVLTGYVVVDAPDAEQAARLASGCPGLRSGVDVEVGEIVVA